MKNHNKVGTKECRLGRWKQRFGEILNKEEPDNPVEIEQQNEIINEKSCEEPFLTEVRNAIKSLKTERHLG